MGSGRHAEGNQRGLTSILLVMALVAAIAGLGWVAFRPQGGGSASGCSGGRAVVVSVVPQMQVPMEKAVRALKEKDDCFPVQMRVETPDAVEDSFFNGGRPDLWVADAGARVDRLALIGINTTTLTHSLASTPIGLVGGKKGERPETWLAALESQRVRYANPEVDSATALALVAPSIEAGTLGTDPTRVDEAVVLAAQNYGELATAGKAQETGLDDIKSGSKRLVPVTEQDFITRGAGNQSVADLTPASGAPRLTFPLVKANGGAPDTDIVAGELQKWFASDAGRVALTDAGLRNAEGEPFQGRGFADSPDLGDIPSESFDTVLGKFGILSVPSSILSLYDLSGSMNRKARDAEGRRIDFAAAASVTALDVFPDHARIGLWGFSIDLGGPGVDYKEMTPLRRLMDETEGMSHKEFMLKQEPIMKGMVGGGTGLYDSVLAAYEYTLKEYDKAYFNSLVIMTDGANDDPVSPSLKETLMKLEAMQDPNRPVRILAIGITKSADMRALEKIAATTGGRAWLAEDPSDIMDVLAQAFMDR